MADVADLRVVVNADTSGAERGLDALGTKVGGVGSAIQTALGAAAVGAVAGLGAAFVGSVKSAADFEKQMSAVSAVSGASASEMEALTKAAMQLGKDTSFSAKEAAQGIEELVKAGVAIEDVIGGGARAALDLAAAGAVSVADAAEIASNAMNVFNLKGADMAHVADVIAGAANASAIGVNDYKFSLSAAGAVAATVGISFESLSQAIAVMGNAGIKGSDAGTSLKTMMMNLIPTTNKQIDLFRDLGITTFNAEKGMAAFAKLGLDPARGAMEDAEEQLKKLVTGWDGTKKMTKEQEKAWAKAAAELGIYNNHFFDANGNAKSFAEISEVLREALKGMTKEQQLATLEVMFGSDAIRAASVMAEAGAAGFNEMAEAMGKVTARQVAEERLNNLAGSLEKLKGSLETAAIMLGGIFTPVLKRMVDGLTDGVNKGIEIIEQLPDAWRTIGQAFEGAWEPSETLTPFMNAVGMLGITFRQMYTTVEPIIVQLGEIMTKVLAQDITGALDQFMALVGSIAAQLAPILATWGQAFINWIAPMIPPFLAAVADIGLQLLAWIAAQIPPLLAQLALWGQQFVAWVAPQIPPLLAALGALGLAVLGWIAEQIPPLIAQLVTWGAEFVAWVAPQIGPLLAELGKLALVLLDWVIAQVPGIVAKLVEWGILFAAWVATTAIPELIKALPGIYQTIVDWIATAALAIGERVLTLGAAIVTGIYNGFVGAWATIGPKIQQAIADTFKIPEIKLPPWLGGGGGSGSGATTLSLGGGGSSHVAPYLGLINQVSAETGVPADVLAALMEVEGSGAGSTSPAGARGLMQVMPNYVLPGENPFDPLTSIRQGARAAREKYNATGSWQAAGRAYFGYGVDAGGMDTNTYGARYDAARARYQQMSSGAGAMDKLLPEGMRAPLDLMETVDQRFVPQWVKDMEIIAETGSEATRVVSESMDATGQQMTSTFQVVTTGVGENMTQMGQIVATESATMIETTAAQNAAITQSYDLMATGTLESVVGAAGAITTTATDTAGNYITTVTSMTGQVLAQYGTLANGATVSMQDMATQTTASVDAFTGHTIQTVTDAMGNVLTTIVGTNGQIIAQTVETHGQMQSSWVTTSDAIIARAAEMGLSVIGSTQKMGEVMVTNAKTSTGEMVKVITNASGEIVKVMGHMANEVGATVVHGLDAARKGFDNLTKSMAKAEDQAKDTAQAIAKMGGEKGGDPDREGNPFAKRAMGGPVDIGETYLVGEHGPELFSPWANGQIIPNHALSGAGGMQTIRLQVELGGRVAEEIYVTGRELALRRGRTS